MQGNIFGHPGTQKKIFRWTHNYFIPNQKDDKTRSWKLFLNRNWRFHHIYNCYINWGISDHNFRSLCANKKTYQLSIMYFIPWNTSVIMYFLPWNLCRRQHWRPRPDRGALVWLNTPTNRFFVSHHSERNDCIEKNKLFLMELFFFQYYRIPFKLTRNFCFSS